MKIKKKTTKAILLYWDEDDNTPRKVFFGDPTDLLFFWTLMRPVVDSQLAELASKEYETPEELQEAMENLSMQAEKINQRTVAGEHLELTYEAK